jgi:hypothetical protein
MRASFMSLDFGGQADVKACATRRVVTSPQTATVRFNDGAANAKSHASALGLRGKERIEDLVRLLRGLSYAGIADRHQNMPVFSSLRFAVERPRPIHIRPRIDRIHHEIH